MNKDYLQTTIEYLPGIGERKSKLLQSELGVYTFRDLLYTFPFRYVDRSRILTVRELRDGGGEVQLRGIISDYVLEGFGRKTRLKATFRDDTGSIELVWFKGSDYISEQFPTGREYIVYGRPKAFGHYYNIVHPEVTPIERASQVAGGLLSVYHTSEKMKRSGLDSKNLRNAIGRLCQIANLYIEETLPEEIRNRWGLIPLPQALYAIHFPKDDATLEKAVQRLKFDELFFLQLSLQLTKKERKSHFKGYLFDQVGEYFNSYYSSLPYDLTQAQKRVLREIRHDTQSGLQMNRLLQGDVGCGKTLVATFSMLLALDNGWQACMMAPTEILAQQHYETLRSQLAPLGIEVALLTGSTPQRERTTILEDLAQGSLRLLVGTHALLEERVQFAHLALAVIDEQHRFGVVQRARLWEKSLDLLPHVLIMSATPIPRTLAMTLYGDLDISVIDELPPGRKPISTRHYFDDFSEEVFRLVEQELFAGRQIYVVYPMIEGTEDSDYKNLETGYEQYRYRFGDRNVTWIHGKLKPQEKQQRMEQFVSGKIPILLSTTVIEVGVNVPNASVMVIENADRFGLAQLHQLRGRVGRGAEQSYCLLLSKRTISPVAIKRIEAMCSSNDGFFIAEEDLKLRGAGDIEGTRQSGDLSGLRLAEPSKDLNILYAAAQTVKEILERDALLEGGDMVLLAEELERIYPKSKRWGSIG